MLNYLSAAELAGWFNWVRFQFAAGFFATIQKVRVHDVVVVGLQCCPKIIFASGVRVVALQAARTLALIASPRIAPHVALGIALFLETNLKIVIFVNRVDEIS